MSSIQGIAKRLTSHLNSDWFNKVYEEFRNHPEYSEADDKINTSEMTYTTFWNNGDDEPDVDVDFIEVQLSLEEIAWQQCNYPGSRSAQPSRLVYKGRAVSNTILKKLLPLMKQCEGPRDKVHLLKEVNIACTERVAFLKKKFNNSGYEGVLNYWLKMNRDFLFSKFKTLIDTHNSVILNNQKLFFNLSLKQLAYVFALFKEADFLEDTEGENSMLSSFASTYFFFKNRKAGSSYSRAIHFYKEFRAAQNYQTSPGEFKKVKAVIKEKLLGAIKKLDY